MAKLVLGTAQFGLDYGINNNHGKISQNEVMKILEFAYSNNIRMLDTASAYGDSEIVLGKVIGEINKIFEIITKYPSGYSNSPLIWINSSLQSLKTESIYGCLFHSYLTFQKHPEYIEDFIKIKESGKVKKIGFSLYYPSEAEYIISNSIPCDIVQVPYNVFDQRFAFVFSMLKSKNIEIHVRSVFLQGLFFIPLDKIDESFLSVKDNLAKLQNFANVLNFDVSTLCFGFVNQNKYIDKIVIGIDSLDNLVSNVNNFKKINETKIDYSFLDELSVIDEKIILPFNWNLKRILYSGGKNEKYKQN
jgi:aryl-alcohol dehydrogenase-like predicted oxidoreductase